MPVRKRVTLATSLIGHGQIVDSFTGEIIYQDFRDCTFTNYQITSSEGHPWRPSRDRKYSAIAQLPDIGGPFDTRKIECINAGYAIVSLTRPGGYLRKYDGPIFAYYSNYIGQNASIQNPSSDAVLDGLGSTAISRVLPTNPLSGMGQFLSELRELPTASKLASWAGTAAQLRSIKKAPKGVLKRGSQDWLNFQFGWVPFVKDLKDFFTTARDADKHIRQLERDSGRNVRRKFKFPDEVSTVVTNMGSGYGDPVLDSYLYTSPGILTKTVTTRVSRWFSGCFTYYLEAPGLARLEQYSNRLYGTRISTDLLWKLGPWSWAADWITNFGDVVHNTAAFANDGLVMRYGYMMEKSVIITEYSLKGLTMFDGRALNLTQSFVTTTMKRRRATPYGFGFDPGTFTARQWSIIAALGISKRPRQLQS